MSDPSNNESSTSETKEEGKTKPHIAQEDVEKYAYDLYPDRFGREEKSLVKEVLTTNPFKGPRAGRQLNCIANVYRCVQSSSSVQILLGALQSHGCPVSVSRNMACEDCLGKVNGGYDPVTNQIVICQNNSKPNRTACSVLAHELIHMFDLCRAELDFKNPEHLACSEIRAANFMHCSFLSAWESGSASPLRVKNQHRECVRQKAVHSVLMARDIPREEALAAVDKVFDRCYNDMEPLGRRPSDGTHAMDKAKTDAFVYGYQEWLPFDTSNYNKTKKDKQ